MKLPNLSKPVSRSISNSQIQSGVQSSSILCTACCLAAKVCPSLGTVCSLAGCSC